MPPGQCSNERRLAGLAYPRTCQLCGLGPCQGDAARPSFRDAGDLSAQIAAIVFPHNLDRARRDELSALLTTFAAAIKRSAIEP